MQATQIKAGKEYAVNGYGGVYRARCEDAPTKGIYERSRFFLFRKLEIRTGEATEDTFKVVSRDVLGLWADHDQEVLEHRRKQEEQERARVANKAEIEEILTEMGFVREDFAIRGSGSFGQLPHSAIRVDARIVAEHSGVDIELPALRAWRERQREQAEL